MLGVPKVTITYSIRVHRDYAESAFSLLNAAIRNGYFAEGLSPDPQNIYTINGLFEGGGFSNPTSYPTARSNTPTSYPTVRPSSTPLYYESTKQGKPLLLTR